MSYQLGTCHLEVLGSGMLDSDRKWCLFCLKLPVC